MAPYNLTAAIPTASLYYFSGQSDQIGMTRFSSAFFSKTLTKILNPQTVLFNSFQTRRCISSKRKTAFTESLLRYLRLSHPPATSEGRPSPHPFSLHPFPGDRCFRLTRSHGPNEFIKIDATAASGFDDGSDNSRSSDVISLIVEVSKGDECEITLQFVCSAFNGGLDVENVFPVRKGARPMQPFMGPEFCEMDEDLQKAVWEYLEERGVNDELALFLHDYMKVKHKHELVRWLKNVEFYIKK